MMALIYPKRLVIIKCQAHKTFNDFIVKGDNGADEAAKITSKCTISILTAPMVIIECIPQLDYIIRIQEQAGLCEKSMWHHRGATKDGKGLWRSHEGIKKGTHYFA